MGTVKEKIINALTLFYQAIKSVFVQTSNVVDNCASTSTSYPLSANQGTNLQGQIDDINSTLATYSIPSFWNGWTASANIVSINKKARTATVNLVLDGANATSNEVLRYDLNALETCIANKGLPLPRGGSRFPVYCLSESKFTPLSIYTTDNITHYMTLVKGYKYEIVGSYITEGQ